MDTTTVQYISDANGKSTGVIVPIELWRTIQTQLKLSKPNKPDNAWDVLETYTGTVEAPSDWSIQHDHYLYGTPKQPMETTK
jgi:hypothetical protein